MFSKISRFFNGYDWVLLLSVLFLVVFGLSVIYATSLGDEGLTRFIKQLIFLGIGGIGIVIMSRIDYRWIGSLSWVLWGLSIIVLILVLVIGTNVRGTTGWFIIGPFSIQPVEFVKIAMIIVFSFALARESRPSVVTWWRTFAFLVPIIILLYLQPDFGPIFLLVAIWLTLNALRGLSKKGWAVLFFSVLVISVVGWFGVLTEHQKGRIQTFINPGSDPTGRGFQVKQSIIAVGSGGITGQGVGQGLQSQLQFLPEAPTDFVFASFLEQLGMVGFLLLLATWCVFFWRIIRIVNRSQDNYTLYLALGFGVMVFIQTSVNVAMNIGLAPIVGLPLPFLSYGGSSLISALLMVGILESIAVRQKV